MNKNIVYSIVIFVIISHSFLHVAAENGTEPVEMNIIQTLEEYLISIGFRFNNDRFSIPIEEDVGLYLMSRTITTLTKLHIYDDSSTALIDPTLKIVFMFHGWTSNVTFFAVDAAIEWLRHKDHNLIIVDWQRLASFNYVTTALVNVPKVAKFIIRYINYLQNSIKLSLDDVILVGHSCGAQISGYIGAEFNGLIGTIYGLDPAGPLFTIPLSPHSKHLDKTDGKYVECLHTACGTEGTPFNCGHVDIYANGGAIQPGCFQSDPAGSMSCSHNRAVQLFTEALNPDNFFGLNKCAVLSCHVDTKIIELNFQSAPVLYLLLKNNLSSAVSNLSNIACLGRFKAIMNFGEQNPPGVYKLTTRSTSPYCQYC